MQTENNKDLPKSKCIKSEEKPEVEVELSPEEKERLKKMLAKKEDYYL